MQQKEAKERNDIRQDALHAVLVLRDGSVFEGTGFGASCKVAGEVVFNTGMMGYTQAVTDCSYRGQILCQTYPLIGNYGVCRSEFESEKPRIQGYAVFEACRNPSHHTSEMTLHQWLKTGGDGEPAPPGSADGNPVRTCPGEMTLGRLYVCRVVR